MSNIITLNENINLVMNRYSDHYFDFSDADPPYFSGPEKRKYYGRSKSPIGVKRVDYPVTDTWELPNIQWFNEFKRTCKNWIIWGANYFDFISVPFKTPRRHEIDEFIAQHPIGWIIWDKCNGDSDFNDYELAFTSFNQPTQFFTFMWNGMCQGKSITEGHLQRGDKRKNQKRIHPTEKPIGLYDWAYKVFTNGGGKILNTHGGSLSCAISATKFNFIEYVVTEINETHFKAGIKRLTEYQYKTIQFPL